ncbi:MAG: GC-type dockerin domain-anchored protein [Phycisphaerales bacterium]
MRTRSALVLAACCGTATVASAQPIMWASGSGAWGSAANWSPMNVPDNAGEDAILGGGSAYTVSLSGPPAINPNIGSLSITNPMAELLVEGGRTITLNSAASTNNGIVSVNPAGSGAAGVIALAGPVTLGGTGEVQLRTGGGFSRLSGLGSLANGASHTIRGVGQFTLPSMNLGLIAADSSLFVAGTNSLQFTNAANCANMGTLASRSASTLDLLGMQVDQTGGGQLLLDGGIIQTSGSSIVGGQINTTGSGTFQTIAGTTSFSGVAVNAPVRIAGGTTVSAAGSGISNNNVIAMNDTGAGAAATLRFDADGTLGGTGEVRMQTGGAFTQMNTGTNITMTNGAAHTIRGVGNVNARLVNQGTVRADASVAVVGTELLLQTSTKTNNASMEAATGSTLTISSITVDQTGGGVLLADGGTIGLSSATILGGAVNATGGGLLNVAAGTNVLNSVILNTPTDLDAGRTISVAGTGLMNNGLLRVNPSILGSAATLRFDQDGVLTGSGEVRLMANGPFSVLNSAAGVTITHDAGHLIRGVGQVNALLVNDGDIVADDSVAQDGFPLTLQTGNKVNNANMEAAAGSELAISGITIDQTGGGNLRATGTGAIVTFSSATILGGSVIGTGGGMCSMANGTSVFESVTLNTDTDLLAGRVLVVRGSGLANNGLLRINPAQLGSAATFRFDESGTLGGTGEVRLVTNGPFAVVSTGAGATITHAAGHTIRGTGQVNASLVNNGAIVADDSVGQNNFPLVLQTSDKANNATMTAAASSELLISGIEIDQTGGGVINATGADAFVSLASATIDGGSINASGGGLLRTSAGVSTLRNVTLNTDTDVNAGHDVNIEGAGLVNNGLLRVNPLQVGSQADLRFNQSGTLGGTGSVELTTTTVFSRIVAETGVTVTHVAPHAITGQGQIVGTGSFINRSDIAPGTNGPGSMQLSGNFTNHADGDIFIQIGGTGTADFDRFTNAGTTTISLDGTLDVSLLAPYVPARQDTMRIMTGTTITGRFDTVVRPPLPAGVAMRVVYLPTAVDIWFHCPPDLTTGAIAGQAGFGVPNGVLNNDDFFFYLAIFAAGDPDADLTTGAIPGQPGFGVPNGQITNDDFFFYLSLFAGGC